MSGKRERAGAAPRDGEAWGPQHPGDSTFGIPVSPERPRYLVLWSGGLDSTWSLYMLLRHTDADVCAHHVVKRSRTDDGKALSHGWLYERAAIRRMRPWLAREVRPFPYSESAIDLTAFASFARDTVTALFLAGQAAKNWGFGPGDALILGGNADDDRMGDPDPELYWRGAFRRLLARNLLQAVMQEDRTPEVHYLIPAPTRARQIADLPAELTAMTASCRMPVRLEDGGESFRPCGRCPTCLALARHLPVYAEGPRDGPDAPAAGLEPGSGPQ